MSMKFEANHDYESQISSLVQWIRLTGNINRSRELKESPDVSPGSRTTCFSILALLVWLVRCSSIPCFLCSQSSALTLTTWTMHLLLHQGENRNTILANVQTVTSYPSIVITGNYTETLTQERNRIRVQSVIFVQQAMLVCIHTNEVSTRSNNSHVQNKTATSSQLGKVVLQNISERYTSK